MRIQRPEYKDRFLIENLLKQPSSTFQWQGSCGINTANISIPYIKENIRSCFPDSTRQRPWSSLVPFEHLGITIEYVDNPTLTLFDENSLLLPEIKALVAEFGVLVIKNAQLINLSASSYQENIFTQLVFHVDRGRNADDQYTLFYRNPSDPKHEFPRTTSTLIAPNAVVKLHAEKEGLTIDTSSIQQLPLFANEHPENSIGQSIVEQKWDSPDGTGEICILDNRTVMHASYHRQKRGYSISVKYLI